MAARLKDIAELAGVSVVTVSYVLNNKNRVGEKTREKVLQAAKKLNYVPNRAASTLAGKASRQICLVVSGPAYEYLSNPYIYKLVTSVKCLLDKLGYELTIRMTTSESEYEFILSELNSKLYDGILVWGTRMIDTDFQKLFTHKTPLVSIARDDEQQKVNSVTIEHYQCAYQMTQHLLNQGYEKIMFLGKLDTTKAARDRYLGYKQALVDNQIEFDETWAMEADYYQESAYEIIKHYPDFDYQAIFCGSDMMAIGAMKALLEKGVKIPQDVALAGFDNIPNSDFLPISLTTVDTPIEQLGTKAVEMLIGLIKGNCETRTIKLDAKVLVRQST